MQTCKTDHTGDAQRPSEVIPFPSPTPLGTWLTLDEVAHALNLPRSTVYLLAQRGELAGARRFGRAWRVSQEKLQAALAADEVQR